MSKEVKKDRKVGFVPEFLHPGIIKENTEAAIARLEVEKHNVHLVVAVNDDNWDFKFENGDTATETIERLEKAIDDLKSKFADILSWTAPEE